MKLKRLIVRFFLLGSLFIIGGPFAAYGARAKAGVISPGPHYLTRIWLILVVTVDSWTMALGKAVYNIIDTVIGHILQIIALIISNMIAGSYYKLHGTHNDDGELWQKFKQRLEGLLTK